MKPYKTVRVVRVNENNSFSVVRDDGLSLSLSFEEWERALEEIRRMKESEKIHTGRTVPNLPSPSRLTLCKPSR